MNIGDYAMIGDCTTAALVGLDGAIDWLCWPRFDSGACFARLLGDEDNGRWRIAPADPSFRSHRRYRDDSMILETEFQTSSGRFALIDFMPMEPACTSLVRIVEGREGVTDVCMSLKLRFDYGSTVPWVHRDRNAAGTVAIAGPNLVILRASVPTRGAGLSTVSTFRIAAGQRHAFVLSYGPSHRPPPAALDVQAALRKTQSAWQSWVARCDYEGPWREAMIRSLLTLKSLTYADTGGIIAAPTTSLPEKPRGTRNWDYRYCWIRDATLTLSSLIAAGYHEEAKAWRDWLLRSLAGTPEDLQIMYGISGERRLAEWEVAWLPGFDGSSPVRVGNAASGQLQLDIWGEMMDVLHLARRGRIAPCRAGWDVQCEALRHLGQIWREPDDGIWEVRYGRRQFTHSKIMAWVAFDRMIKDVRQFGFKAPLDRWRAVRDEIHRTVCDKGFHRQRGAFTQAFGSEELDASLLLMPEVGFLPVTDARVQGTIAAIERELLVDGFVRRYRTERVTDGLPGGEGVFLPCSFWLADVYERQGRHREAHAMLERLLALRNDVGLLSEEYDTRTRQLAGNFPQAFSHLSLVQSLMSLHHGKPMRDQVDERARSVRE
ncbi:MAG: glycoside hydrolase family 15 protein [Steroidobacteraceae bacterium]